MNRTKSRSQAGFSLVEMVIVVVIVILLTTFAIMRFTTSKDVMQRQNIAREFKNSLERARFDAVKRRPNSTADMSVVKVINETSFSYTTDRNQNGSIESSAETITVDFVNRSNQVKVLGSFFIYPITITFDRRGQIRARDGWGLPVNPTFYFCDRGCTPQTATSANSNIVYVSPTGTVSMMRGGDTVPTFSNPSVTAVSGGTSVNPSLSVWDLDTTSTNPTPTPTPSPAASPTPTPTPTPSVSPSPSPTPISCTLGEKPSVTGCKCTSPMWQRKNGKCM